MKKIKKNILILFILLITPTLWASQVIDLIKTKKPYYTFSSGLSVSYFKPTGYYEKKMDSAPFINLNVGFNPRFFNHFLFHLEAGYATAPVKDTSENYSLLPIGVGASYHLPLLHNFFIGAQSTSGFYFLNLENKTYRNYYLKIGTSLKYRFTYHLSTTLNADYLYLHDSYGGPKAFQWGLGFHYAFGTPLAEKDVQILSFKAQYIFAALYTSYYEQPIGSLKLKNTTGATIKNVTTSLKINNYMDEKTTLKKIPVLKAGQTIILPIYAFFNKSITQLTEDIGTTGVLEIKYEKPDGGSYLKRDLLKLKILNKNALVWDDLAKLGTFINKKDVHILSLARLASQTSVKNGILYPTALLNAIKIVQTLKQLNIKYVNDPTSYRNLSKGNVDYIQYPAQTLAIKSGDCDDLTVLLASMLESIGIPTAFISTPGHIFLMFQVENLPLDDKIITYAGKKWIPIETTLINQGFTHAWMSAYQLYKKTLKKEILTIAQATKKYAPVYTSLKKNQINLPKNNILKKSIKKEIIKMAQLFLFLKKNNLNKLKMLTPELLNDEGIKLCQLGQLKQAEKVFLLVLEKYKTYIYSYYNLMILYRLQKKYTKVIAVFQQLKAQNLLTGKAYYYASQAYFNWGKYKLTEKFYEQALKKDKSLKNDIYQQQITENKGVKNSKVSEGAVWEK